MKRSPIEAKYQAEGARLSAETHGMADDRVRCCRGRRPGCEADAGGQPERHKQARHGHGFLNCWSTTLSRTMNPVGTTKECAVCGVETAKLIWVRERSCPAYGHTEDCDLNAAKNILSRGLKKPGVGRSESASSESRTDSILMCDRELRSRHHLCRLRSLRSRLTGRL